ncbi:sugar ABC transporter permease, partial [Streptomyces pharetrae]
MTVQTERPPSGPADVRKGADVMGSGRPTQRAASRAGALGPYLLLLPACAATVLLLGWPLVKDVLLSFQNLNMAQLIQHVTEWNGIDNYKEVLTGEDFWRVTLRSILFTAVNVVLTMLLGALVGLLLARLGKRMRFTLMVGLVLAWA